MSLKGKRAIVTGSMGALGMVITRRFLDEGLKVVGTYRNLKELSGLSNSVPQHIVQIQADVTIETEVQSMFETVIRTMGGIDILVNTVGGFLPRKPIPDVTVEEWDRMMNMNLKSTFIC